MPAVKLAWLEIRLADVLKQGDEILKKMQEVTM